MAATTSIGCPVYPAVYDHIDSLAAQLGISNPSTVDGSYGSCGVSILSGLSHSPAEVIVAKVLKQRHPLDRKRIREAFVTFSDTDNGGKCSGNALYKYIKDNNLGQIHEFGPRMNPNTGNMIKFWVWEPPHETLSPRYKYMPVYGKIQQMDPYGNFSGYADAPNLEGPGSITVVVGREA